MIHALLAAATVVVVWFGLSVGAGLVLGRVIKLRDRQVPR